MLQQFYAPDMRHFDMDQMILEKHNEVYMCLLNNLILIRQGNQDARANTQAVVYQKKVLLGFIVIRYARSSTPNGLTLWKVHSVE